MGVAEVVSGPRPAARSTAELRAAVDVELRVIAVFVESAPFRALLAEMYALGLEQQRAFVLDVLLDRAELARRGVDVPPGTVIQRSRFGDGRPTLFCVSRPLPEGMPWGWYKVTYTFDARQTHFAPSRTG